MVFDLAFQETGFQKSAYQTYIYVDASLAIEAASSVAVQEAFIISGSAVLSATSDVSVAANQISISGTVIQSDTNVLGSVERIIFGASNLAAASDVIAVPRVVYITGANVNPESAFGATVNLRKTAGTLLSAGSTLNASARLLWENTPSNIKPDCPVYPEQVSVDDISEMEGFALYANTTGGLQRKKITVTNSDDSGTGSLRWACDQARSNGGATIVFKPAQIFQITLASSIYIPSNTTIDGIDALVNVSSADNVSRFRIQNDANVIVRRMTITSTPTADEIKRDGITVDPATADRVWINRCTFISCGDGCVDIYSLGAVKNNLFRGTVSYCRFYNHDKVMLIGTNECALPSRDNAVCASMLTSRRTIYVSVQRNFFDRTGQRQPRVSGPVYAHVWNNVYNLTQVDGGAVYGVYGAGGCRVLVESNFFKRLGAVGNRAAYAKTTPAAYDPETDTYTEGPGAVRCIDNVTDAYLELVDANTKYVPDPIYSYTKETPSQSLAINPVPTIYPIPYPIPECGWATQPKTSEIWVPQVTQGGTWQQAA